MNVYDDGLAREAAEKKLARDRLAGECANLRRVLVRRQNMAGGYYQIRVWGVVVGETLRFYIHRRRDGKLSLVAPVLPVWEISTDPSL